MANYYSFILRFMYGWAISICKFNYLNSRLISNRFDKNQAIGKKCYDLMKTSHCRTDKCALTRAMQEDRTVSEETLARPREGVIMPIKYTGSPIKDAKGNIIGALEFVLDETEKKKVEGKIAEASREVVTLSEITTNSREDMRSVSDNMKEMGDIISSEVTLLDDATARSTT